MREDSSPRSGLVGFRLNTREASKARGSEMGGDCSVVSSGKMSVEDNALSFHIVGTAV